MVWFFNTPGGQKWRPTCTGSEVCPSIFWINASQNTGTAARPVWEAGVHFSTIPATGRSLLNS